MPSFPSRTATMLVTAFAVLSLLGRPPIAGAEGPDAGGVLTLERAVELAEAHNLDLAAADARLGAAQAEAEMARAGRLPALRLEASVRETTNPTLVFSDKLGQESFAEQDFAVGRLNDPDAFTNWQGRLTLEMPLWTGGRLGHAIGAAAAARDAASSGREATRQHVVQATIDAWTAVVVARERVVVAEMSLDTARAHLRLVRDLREAGLVVASDPLQAEVRLAEVEEMLARSRADAAVAEAALRLVLGGEPESDVELRLPADLPARDAAGDPPVADTGRIEALVDEAVGARPDLAALRSREDAATEMAGKARADWLPEVGLGAFAEANDSDFWGVGSSAEGSNWGVEIGLRYDLFDPMRKARIARAEHGVDEAAALGRHKVEQIRMDVRRAVHQERAAVLRLRQWTKAVELAQKSLEIVRDRYENGLALVTELLDAETALTHSRLRRLAAERDLRVARASLDLAVGRL